MSDQPVLALACQKPNKRPSQPTAEMIERVALLVAADLKRGGEFDESDTVESIAEDITQAYRRASSHDGYDIARQLENDHGWMPSAAMVEDLDGMSTGVDRELREAERQWAAENPMDPPFPVGATINTRYGPGIIGEIYKHRPATYLVNVEGREGSPLILFEDAVLAQ